MRTKDAKARELRYAAGIHLGISACADPRLKSLVQAAACQGSAL
jgi:hypothetical protein